MSTAAAVNARQLSAMRIADPLKWSGYILSALRETKGDVRAAAKRLGVSERTMHRWVREPSLEAALRLLPQPPRFLIEPPPDPSLETPTAPESAKASG